MLPRPINIQNLTLVSELAKDKISKPYQYLLYRSKNGTKLFAKSWLGSRQSLYHTFIKNEIDIYQTIDQINPLSLAQIYSESGLHIPAYYGQIIKPKLLSLFIEYVDGSPIKKVNPQSKAKIYLSVSKLLTKITSKLSTAQYNSLPRRSFIYYLLLTPIVYFKAIICQPRQVFLILSFLPEYFFGLLMLTRHQSNSLVHRDLGDYNFIKTKSNKIYLIDFQITVRTYPQVELVNILLKNWQDEKFRLAIVSSEQFVETLAKNKPVFKMLSCFQTFYDLGQRNGGEQTAALNYLHFLKSL